MEESGSGHHSFVSMPGPLGFRGGLEKRAISILVIVFAIVVIMIIIMALRFGQ